MDKENIDRRKVLEIYNQCADVFHYGIVLIH